MEKLFCVEIYLDSGSIGCREERITAAPEEPHFVGYDDACGNCGNDDGSCIVRLTATDPDEAVRLARSFAWEYLREAWGHA